MGVSTEPIVGTRPGARRDWTRSPALLRRLALASVVVNIGIVVSGGAVRLTGSGLGCPTWPRCSGNRL
ncbi:MAG TPA: COX15/CtaA family protein, partial [Jatrophihabitans sp.]|nr:COX15/CtaA family protein [Jatrophihabitans sp.]